MENLPLEIIKNLKNRNETISFMESCTGGFLSNNITNMEGSSEVIKVSLVTYSNEYKINFGVSKNIIDEYTAYSFETAKEMAKQTVIPDSKSGRTSRIRENRAAEKEQLRKVETFSLGDMPKLAVSTAPKTSEEPIHPINALIKKMAEEEYDD